MKVFGLMGDLMLEKVSAMRSGSKNDGSHKVLENV